MRSEKLLLTLGFSLAFLVAAGPAAAQVCTITTTSVVFGNYSVYGALPVDNTGTITIRCNSFANSVIVDLSNGNAFNFTPRYMLRAGVEQLTYNVFLDAARTTIWGDNTGGSSHYGPVNPPNNTNVDITIYGRITAGQDVSGGSYIDSFRATVNF